MAQETAIAYGIEFYVGRRSRDRALSDIKAAGEMVNLQASRSYKAGAQQREKEHATSVGKLRKNSKDAVEALATTRDKAIAGATSSMKALTPMSPEDALSTGKIDSSQLDAYTNKFSAQLRAMGGSLAEFSNSASNLGMEFEGTDQASIMKGFGEGDAQQRKAALDDLDTRQKRRADVINSLKKEQEIRTQSLKIAKERKKVLSGKKGELANEKAKLDAMKKTDAGFKAQKKLVSDLRKEQTANNKLIKSQPELLKEIEAEMEKQEGMKKTDIQLLRELKRLHSELSGEEIRTSKVIRANKDKERQLDKGKREASQKAILQLKEQNRLMQEYSRHIDDAAAQIGGTLKTAFVVGTAAIAALNYKLMEVVGAFQEFETQLVNANSIWQVTNETLFSISDQVVKFGTEFGINMGQASEGLYQYASAGVSAAQSMEMLNHTLKLSMAVQGDHNTLSKLTVQTIMGFGMTMDDTAMVTDKFAHSINKSLIEWDDLASSVKFALPFFTSTGQSIDQLLGGLEILTNRALEAGIAGRGLRQALAEFAQHADDNTAAFRKMGVEIMNTDGTMKQLTEIAQEFNRAMGDGATDMDVMITLMEDLNVRGATAFVHLAQNADEFESAVNNLSNSAGSAHEMAMIQQNSLANQIQVVKNAMLAPFLLSDKIGEEAGYLNKFAKEVHGIVDVVEGLFIKTMDDGSIALTKMGKIIRDFVIGSLITAKEILVIVVKVMGDFSREGNSMVGLLQLFAVPLKIVAKLMDKFNGGFIESVVQYKLMNSLLPINSVMLAQNLGAMMKQSEMTKQAVMWRGKEFTQTQIANIQKQHEITLETTLTTTKRTKTEASLASLKVAKLEAAMNITLAGSFKVLMMSQMATQMAMMGVAVLTQKFAKDSPGWAAAIGALGGAFVGLSMAMHMVDGAKNDLSTPVPTGFFVKAAIMGAAAGAAYNIAMQQLMKPPDMSSFAVPQTDYSTMDTGGRFMKRRSYDMGGYTQDHGLAVLQKGETVISKTQNMLGGASGSGITLNIHGDVYDSDNFAQKISEVLPIAMRKTNDIGGI